MSNAEIEVRGTGRVLAIKDCPPIADGEGSVVIARIKTHRAGKLVELHFENGETLTGTASHPIWSADRQDWVPLGELQEGEHTQSRDGLLRITRRVALPDMQPVYNLEVHGEHVYEVTQAGVLVHNNDCLTLAVLRAKKAAGELTDPNEVTLLAALEQKVLDGTLVGASKGGLPDFLKQLFKKGEDFNKENRGRYPYNEVEVTVDGKTFRVDSYSPGQEIVSRRLTQFADIQEMSAVGYFNEFIRKYASGTEITSSNFNPKVLRGDRLRGDLIFEVPVQSAPIPQAILDAATIRGITIRDITGQVYN